MTKCFTYFLCWILGSEFSVSNFSRGEGLGVRGSSHLNLRFCKQTSIRITEHFGIEEEFWDLKKSIFRGRGGAGGRKKTADFRGHIDRFG